MLTEIDMIIFLNELWIMNNIRKFFQHNWPAVFYLNFKMLPIKQAIKLPLDIYYGVRFDKLSGNIILNSHKVFRGMVKFGAQGSDMFQRKGCILSVEGTLLLNGKCVFGCSNTIKIRKGAEVIVGDNSIFGAENLIYSEKSLSFGSNFLSSWKCQFMDSDTHRITDITTSKVSISVSPVVVGNHCWIGNNVKINKGVCLPNETIVASNSVITKNFMQEGENCVLAGIPAKVVRRNKKWSI